MVLLEDEKLVLKWLSQYGPLTKFQLLGLLSYKTPRVAEKIVRNVRKAGRIRCLESGYYALDKYCSPDPKKVLSVWILLRFIEKVRPTDHRPAEYPAEIFFVKDSQAYEIVIIPDGEEYIAQLIKAEEGKRYIFVISDIKRVPQLHCPDVPCLFAEANCEDPFNPIIKFYSKGDAGNDET